jgi:flagellar P-ring protein precursor FlgI
MKLIIAIAVVLLLSVAPAARATKIEDVTRLSGERSNTLTGLGLVFGLKGTGDGGSYLPAIQQLATMLTKYDDRVATQNLTASSNIAIVSVTAVTSGKGERNGDSLDVTISSIGSASSLSGGTLFVLPLMGPTGEMFVPVDAAGKKATPIPYAMAQGTVDVEDPTHPTVAVIRNGARMEADLLPKVVDEQGRFTLILDRTHASRSTSNMIAKLINESGDSGEQIAVAVDGKNIVVQIPVSERSSPVAFIANIQQLPVPTLYNEAEIYLNDKTGTMVITGDVEIAPVVISHRGLTIAMVNPPVAPTARTPQVINHTAIPIDTTGTGGPKLEDLAKIFDKLKVPADDRVTIVKQLCKTGRVHAKLVIDGDEK